MRLIFAAAAIAMSAPAFAVPPSSDDAYGWLEEIEGAKPLDTVRKWNAATERTITALPGYERHRQRALALLNDPGQIAMPAAIIGDKVLNHWVDADHKRGLWRIASLDSYLSGKPEWKTLIDVDALGQQEGKSWVWHGASCLAPTYRRCLVSLSPGGTDADVVREFDLPDGKFIDNGFVIPEGKNSAAWLDENTLLVARVEGEGTATRSGYPRFVRKWVRGTSWSAATTVLEGEEKDISVSAISVMDGDDRRTFLVRGIGFFTSQISVLDTDGKAIRLPIPETASFETLIGGRVIVSLVDPLGDFPAGSLVAWNLDDVLAGRTASPELVMKPTASQSIEEVASSDNILWVKALDDVSGKLFALSRGDDGRWSSRPMPLPANATLHLTGTADRRDLAFATVEGMLTPTSLVAITPTTPMRTIESLDAQFDASKFTVDQRFAVSKDGTRIPYFLVRRHDVTKPTGALIHAYGGFRSAQTPGYLTGQPYRAGPLGLFLAEQGDAYVLANIRGGGEYGPGWHKAALREKRQNAFDDLEAVARDLIRTGVARKDGVAISGRSNGGVLTGAAITQHPDLYRAAIIGSPLFDMKRYSHLSAGASWIDEYGDPDAPADWAFMKLYSPYQNIRANVRYPATFFYLSTKDDRVHPGHARKGAAKLKATGSTVYYHEYLEGGHSVGADREEDARRAALLWGFLELELKPKVIKARRPVH
ncbi:MAG: prolyl oligopeptidase family serine peptidase [Sphingomicrobium sp.]